MKKFLPYIREFLIFIFVAMIFTITIICGDYIQIIIKPHFLSYLLLAFIAFSFVYSYRAIINSGVRAIIDCLFKRKCKTTAIFSEVHPCYASDFSDKFTGESARSSKCEKRYTYVFKEKKNIIQLKSTEIFELVPAQKYHITYGQYSKIILSISDD